MFAVPSFFGYNTTFVSTPVATAATGVGETSFTANWNAFAGASYYLLDVSTSSSFSSFVGSYQNFVVLSTSQLVSGLTASTTYYYRLRAATGVDADAAAFFSRVYTAGGALSYTEVSATETLVADLKANSLWTPMKAIYPMIGASAAACAQNLKSSSFTGTFSSGWTFASTGATPNGTSAYMNSSLIPSTNFSLTSNSSGVYIRTQSINTGAQFGTQSSAGAGTRNWLFVRYDATNYHEIRNNTSATTTATTPATSQGFWMSNRPNITTQKLMRNGSTLNSSTAAQVDFSTQSMYLGAVNSNGTANEFTNRQFAFFYIGDGLTDTQASNFYTAVQAFQTTLARQVV